MSFVALCLPNIVQQRSRVKTRSKVIPTAIGANGCTDEPCGNQPVEQFDCQPRHSLRVREIRIQRLCPQLHAPGREIPYLLALWQPRSPYVPTRIGTAHLSLVLVDSPGSLLADS